jgi:sterol desaturase/sphingolipid hydroxylase (fatty acid hydroxylase superfamily)
MSQLFSPHLQQFAISVFRLSAWLAILAVIFVPLERLFSAHPRKMLRKELAVDLFYYFLNSLLPALLLSVPMGLVAWSAHRVIPTTILAATAAMPFWARVFAGLVASETGYYWGHRLSHEIPFLWRFHAIHHSAEDMDFLVNTRAHPMDMVFSRFCSLVPLAVLGLGNATTNGSTIPVLVTLVGTLWGFFIHANLRWRFGPLEWLISTPAFHHWHHTLTGPINKNYSSTLPWLDWLFGTHYLPNEWPDAYGIDAKLPTSLAGQLLYPLSVELVEADAPESAAATPAA